jgi:hypothetical protein
MRKISNIFANRKWLFFSLSFYRKHNSKVVDTIRLVEFQQFIGQAILLEHIFKKWALQALCRPSVRLAVRYF